ncbi:MAG: DUF4124 domain-containing protein [Betaproteobacteria bacterium]
MSLPASGFVRILLATPASTALVALGACALAAALAAIPMPAAAALYKWTDANGRVIYSDQPPTGNFKVEAINSPPPPANPNAVKELAAKEAELTQKRVLRADEEAKATKARTESAQKKEQCAKMRGQIAMLASDQNQQILIFRSNDKGQPVYMDDGSRRREREQLEAWVKENCTA